MGHVEASQIAVIRGKQVSYRKVGCGARKILFFHGFPGSSAQVQPFRELALTFDLEVVSVDRPGYNKSEPGDETQPIWATEAAHEVVQSLGWEKFELMAVSGGTPFLFFFAQKYPELISSITLVSSMAPLAQKKFRRLVPQTAIWALKILPRLPGKFLSQVFARRRTSGESAGPRNPLIKVFLPMSEEDLQIVHDIKNQEILNVSLAEALAQAGRGPKLDAEVYLKDWSTELPRYHGRINIWHGANDRILAPPMAKLLAQSIGQNASNKIHWQVIENEGHYSLAFHHVPAFLNPDLSKSEDLFA